MSAVHQSATAMVPAALIWLVFGLLLLLLELLGAEFDGLLAGAIAALAVSALTGLVALAPLLQVGLFAALTALLLVGLQRWMGRQRQRAIPPPADVDRAEVINGFASRSDGRVRWQGQSWAATNLEPAAALQPGDRVLVMGRDGTRLQVLPDETVRHPVKD
jgi:hypothetical protein